MWFGHEENNVRADSRLASSLLYWQWPNMVRHSYFVITSIGCFGIIRQYQVLRSMGIECVTILRGVAALAVYDKLVFPLSKHVLISCCVQFHMISFWKPFTLLSLLYSIAPENFQALTHRGWATYASETRPLLVHVIACCPCGIPVSDSVVYVPYPDDVLYVAYPDSALSIPVLTGPYLYHILTVPYPDCALSISYPDSALFIPYPDCALSISYPDSALLIPHPDSAPPIPYPDSGPYLYPTLTIPYLYPILTVPYLPVLRVPYR